MTVPSKPEVVLAVVTGPHGVLLVERSDRTPPLAFPGGKVGPGETLLDAARREVLEETAIPVRCGAVLAERVHPDTAVRVAYLACTTTSDTEPSPAPREALTAAWWAIDDAVRELSGALHPAVREHLIRLTHGSTRSK